MRPSVAQHLRHQQPEPAGADDRAAHAGLDAHLLQHAAGRGGRLDEHRRHVAEPVRQVVEVLGWQAQILGKGAIALQDAEHRAHVAMAPPARPAAAARDRSRR